MFGVGYSEFLILIILLGGQGNIGLPLGVPPAEEVQLLSEIAPQDCLFYASWATAGKPDPQSNPTERWFAQNKIHDAWSLILDRVLRLPLTEVQSEDYDEDDAYARNLFELVAQLSGQAMERATAVFIENGDTLEKIRGGCVIQLAPDSVAAVNDKIQQLKNSLPAEWKSRSFVVGNNEFLALTPPDMLVEIAVGLRDQFVIVGFGPDSISKIEQRIGSPEPNWLSDLKQKLPVERRCSFSHIAIRDWFLLLKDNPETAIPEDAQKLFEEILHIDSLIGLDSVCGLDGDGFVGRHRVTTSGKELVGLASIFDAESLGDDDIKRLANQRDFSTGVRLSIPNVLALIEKTLVANGESLEELLEEFESRFGLRLKEDLLDHLDGSLLVQANFDTDDPTVGFLAQLGIGDEMSFFDSFTIFNEKLAELIASDDPYSKFVSDERDGIGVYTIHQDRQWGIIPQPFWFLQGGHVCIALDSGTVDRRIASDEETLLADGSFQRTLDQAGELGLKQPLGITRIKMSALIKMLMSMSSMWGRGLEGGPIQLSDLPPTEVLINGLKPTVSMLFRTDDGFEILCRQTLPGSAPGANIAAIGVLVTPVAIQVRNAAKRVESKNNMRQIMIALHDFHDAYMALPAQFSQDKDGKPRLSWRVQILPFIEEQALYDQFHLDEPWDSEHNRQLIEKMPDVFRHPKLKLEPGKTAYLAPAGVDTVWAAPKDDKPVATGRTLEEISNLDGCSQTIALIEVAPENAVIWTKPDDFDVDREDLLDHLKPIWHNGINVGFADAAVWTFKADLTRQQWRAVFGIRDGQALDLNELQSR